MSSCLLGQYLIVAGNVCKTKSAGRLGSTRRLVEKSLISNRDFPLFQGDKNNLKISWLFPHFVYPILNAGIGESSA
jgi:hypothetical protein